MLQSGNKTIREGPTEPDNLSARYSAYQNKCQEPARWFTESLCGIKFDPEQPGFKHFTLTPHFPSRLPFAKLKQQLHTAKRKVAGFRRMEKSHGR